MLLLPPALSISMLKLYASSNQTHLSEKSTDWRHRYTRYGSSTSDSSSICMYMTISWGMYRSTSPFGKLKILFPMKLRTPGSFE
uniref:Putative secreted peptide n=1 Tax=Anopheles braziliensis TaxID=58242 RepID=A0A2M3ZTX3_9DIPT